MLAERRTGEQIFIVLFGEGSSGKSSLIRALLPGCEAVIDPRRGTTQMLTRYAWSRPDGTSILLTDLPGLNVTEDGDASAWREEALRAHAVIFLTEGDLTRDQYRELQQLARFQKPVILALNKIDHYTRDQREALLARLATRVKSLGDIDIVAISAGGMRPVVKVGAGGREELVSAAVPIEIDALLQSLDRILRRGAGAINASRDSAAWRLAADKLDRAVVARREAHAQEIIDDYTRKAVLGAAVAISPGTDLLIQGYLGMGLVRALCRAYEVSPRELDVSRFLKLASEQVRKTLPLVLTVAGNVCKAFPGVGTLAGGLLHAVGYGIIFESLGRAIAATLTEHGALFVSPALRAFEDRITDDLEARARRLAALAQEGGSGNGRRA
ncbi:MAG: GTPase [Gammaproteobacteria bacterium]